LQEQQKIDSGAERFGNAKWRC